MVKKYAIFGLLVTTVLWGCSYSFSKLAMADIGPSGYLACRMLVAFVLLTVLFHKRFRLINKGLLKAGVAIGIPMALSYLFFMVGLDQTTAAKTGFLSASYVMFVPFLTAFAIKKLPKQNELIGVVIASVGLYFLCLNDGFSLAKADMILILGALFYAISLVAIGKYAQEHNAMLLATLEIGVCCLVSFLYGAVAQSLPTAEMFQLRTILLILFVGVFSTALAVSLQNWAQQYISPTTTSIIFVLEPVVGAICGYFIMHEVLSVSQLVGCLLIIGAMLCGVLEKKVV